jgi:hypothetical protein
MEARLVIEILVEWKASRRKVTAAHVDRVRRVWWFIGTLPSKIRTIPTYKVSRSADLKRFGWGQVLTESTDEVSQKYHLVFLIHHSVELWLRHLPVN